MVNQKQIKNMEGKRIKIKIKMDLQPLTRTNN